MSIIQDQWEEILNTVKEEHELSNISFKTWLKPLQVQEVNEETMTVTIVVPSKQVGIDYISKKYMLPIQVTIAELTGKEYEINFILPDQANRISVPAAATGKNNIYEQANLNPKYTFETFIVGSSNRFAHAASLAVAESPGTIYNPLFIYGGPGLGKTHLMQSIAHLILKEDPNKKVLYVTSEDFTNELILAIRNGNTSVLTQFRDKYRNIDALLIDDIQFIIGKESTQEEFFHTFNTLYNNKKQIIISSDKPPKEIETLEDRLRSRFEWGLIADISLPDYETRMAILHKKEEDEGYNIDPKVIEYIATNIKSNIRELEGALNRLIAFNNLEKREITVEMAQEALRDIISPNEVREITPELIIRTVAEHFNLTPEDLIGHRRNAEIVFPRHIAMYLCRNMLNDRNNSFVNIGAIMGKRDHTTVMNAVNRIAEGIKTTEATMKTVEAIRRKIDPNL